MNKIATFAFAGAAAFALAACGSSDSASEEAVAENVEMPAEEAIAPVEAGGDPGRCRACQRCRDGFGCRFVRSCRWRQHRGRSCDQGCRKEDVICRHDGK